MPQLTKIADIAKKAGDEIRAMQEKVVDEKEWTKKGDESPVSKADKKSNEIVLAELSKHFPTIPVVSEENSVKNNKKAMQSKEYFCIDPLDNTRSYLEKKNGYSVNIARIKNGKPVEGAIYFPHDKKLYFTNNGKAYLQSHDRSPKEIHVKKLANDGTMTIATGFRNNDSGLTGNIVTRERRYPGQRRTCEVASGDSDGVDMTGWQSEGFRIWDVSAPQSVVEAAGGFVVDKDGNPLRYNGDNVILPQHIAGSREALIVMGISSPEQLKAVQQQRSR